MRGPKGPRRAEVMAPRNRRVKERNPSRRRSRCRAPQGPGRAPTRASAGRRGANRSLSRRRHAAKPLLRPRRSGL